MVPKVGQYCILWSEEGLHIYYYYYYYYCYCYFYYAIDYIKHAYQGSILNTRNIVYYGVKKAYIFIIIIIIIIVIVIFIML